jgi:hypothetical protein
MAETTEAPAEGQSLLGDISLFEQLKEWFRQDADHSHDWRIQAREYYAFVAGDQWTAEDAAKMRLELRPIITFNRIAPVIDTVSGMEVANRQEVRYIPRRLGQAGVNELLTEAAKWARDECNAEDEESDAFVDTVICGYGWTETQMEYEDDPDGMCIVRRIDALEMYADMNASKRNLMDARRMFRVRDMGADEAQEMFPGFTLDEIDAKWADDTASVTDDPHDAQEAPFYRHDQSPDLDKRNYRVRVVEAQWWEKQTVVRYVDPTTGQMSRLERSAFDKLQARVKAIGGPDLMHVEQKQKVYRRAFLGSRILKVLPGPKQGGFTWKCITGKRDRNKGTWYGIVRAMIDPQKWANKWLAQTLHIMNTNAKGGIIAEEDAFDDVNEAQDTWSSPDAITIVSRGAISGQKIMPKPQVQFPAGMDQLMQFAVSSIRDVSGVNLELLGMVNRDQPGIVEDARKQAGMTVLASMFDGLRRYRKEQGRLLLWYLTTFMSDGRLVRIGGPESAQYVPLIRMPDTLEYDVIVDDTPSSPNLKEKTWDALMQLMPMLQNMQVPAQVWIDILQYSPLPSTLVADIERAVSQAQQQPNPMQQIALQEQQARVGEINSKTQLNQASAQEKIAHAHQAMQPQPQQQANPLDMLTELVKARAANTKANADAVRAAAEMHTALNPPVLQAPKALH